MTTLIECSTCGYPLLPEEREGLVEINGKMCKRREPLTDEEILKMWDDTRNDPIAPTVFCLIACVRHVERAHGIGDKK